MSEAQRQAASAPLDHVGAVPARASVLAAARAAVAGREGAVALGLALLLGALVRAVIVLGADFPLNDGGLFYQMTGELQRAGYRLPAFTAYNGEAIPFGYPPLAFYVAGLLDDLTPVGLVDLFRVLPLVVTSLTVGAFALLARRLLPSTVAVVAATAAFALLPRSFIWMLMGGGVTRSFGFLFSILALHQAHVLYTTRRWRYAGTMMLCASLTVLSHLGTAPFVAFSIAVFFVAYGRHWVGVLGSAVAAVGTVVLTAPWWATLIRTHGTGPLLAAGATGGSIFSDPLVRYETKLYLLRFGIGSSSEPWFPVLYTLALVGMLVTVFQRRLLVLPAWWLVIVLLDVRARPTLTMIPVALLVGLAVSTLLADGWLARLAGGGAGGSASRDILPASAWRAWWARLAPGAALAGLAAYATLGAVTTRIDLAGESHVLQSLTPADRDAMRWVREHTPPASRFALISGAGASWAGDRHAEWFPALAERRSVGTVQGSEWLARGTFAARVASAEVLQDCRTADAACIEAWARGSRTAPSHVYVVKTGDEETECCTALLSSLRADPRYRVVYDGPAAAVFAAPSDGDPAAAPRVVGAAGAATPGE